jgi:hypothetical protein
MYSVATCIGANVLSEQKRAMVSVTLNRTMQQAMSVENEACASRQCSADMQEAFAALFAKRRPDRSRCVRERGVAPGPMRALQPSGVSNTTDEPWAFLDRADDHEGVRLGVDSTGCPMHEGV